MPEVTIPVGPQHPALKEPECFKVTVDGERIVRAEVRLGYNHRGIEKACEERTYLQDIYLLERVCGICSHSHSTAFVNAVEECGGIEVPPRARYIRVLIGELERIHSHLLWLGVAGHEVGFDTLLMYAWRDREVVMDLLALLTGNRVNYGMNTLGGVRRDVTAEQIEAVRRGVDLLEERTKVYIDLANTETTLVARLSGVGVLSKEDAVRLGALGPTARASGVDIDVRRDDPHLVYGELEFDVITDDHCDVYGRTVVRLGELMQTYRILRQVLDRMPPGEIGPKRPPRKVAPGEAVSRYEAPRGEDVHYVRSNGTDKPERVKVRAPTLGNLPAVAKMLENGYIADIPIVVAAIDPCFSCTDRGIRLVGPNGPATSTHLDWEALRRHGIAFYGRRGLDLGGIRVRGA